MNEPPELAFNPFATGVSANCNELTLDMPRAEGLPSTKKK